MSKISLDFPSLSFYTAIPLQDRNRGIPPHKSLKTNIAFMQQPIERTGSCAIPFIGMCG